MTETAKPDTSMTDAERDAFLAEPHIAVLSVAGGDDRPPHAVPVFYGYAPGGDLTFYAQAHGRTNRKVPLIRAAGRVSLNMQQPAYPYRYVTVEGTVTGEAVPPSREQMLAIVGRYLPARGAAKFVDGELGRPDQKLVLFTVRPDRFISFDASRQR